MMTPPTTTVTLLGGQTVDRYGDTVEGSDPLATDIPAAIIETRQPIISTESDGQAVAVKLYTARLPHGTAVLDSQRLLDQRTGHIYAIDYVTTPAHPTELMDVRLDLRRVT